MSCIVYLSFPNLSSLLFVSPVMLPTPATADPCHYCCCWVDRTDRSSTLRKCRPPLLPVQTTCSPVARDQPSYRGGCKRKGYIIAVIGRGGTCEKISTKGIEVGVSEGGNKYNRPPVSGWRITCGTPALRVSTTERCCCLCTCCL